MSKHEPLEALARAYDREDASQRGEPDPWKDAEDDAEWVSERLACAQVAEAAYLAARSAPEAGKAVDETLPLWRAGSWGDGSTPPYLANIFCDAHEATIAAGLWKEHAAAIVEAHNDALASVAPSGAEPIGWQWKTLDTWHTIDKSSVADPEAYARTQAGGGQYRPIYAAPQAVPAEDVANLIAATEAELAAGSLSTMGWNTRSIALVRRLLAALTSISTIAEERRSMSLEWKNACERSEAEATSLRRKLEATREALHVIATGSSYEWSETREEALQEALKLCSLADTMTACRGDDDFIAGVRAKIEAAFSTEPGEAEGWRDMSSAPKTGEILLWGKYWSDDQGYFQRPLMGYWNERNGRWEATGEPYHKYAFGVRPTRWHPLPAAPLPEDTHHGR